MTLEAARTRTDEDLAFAGVAGLRDLLADGTVTAPQLVDLYLARIERLDPQLRAFRTVRVEAAQQEAKEAQALRDAGDPRPLLGIPIAVKDTFDVGGETSPQGTRSPALPAQRDAELVRRLRAAGLVVLGKTNLPELALWPFTDSPATGTTANPWHLDRITGGSSGGSAAAVAAGLAPAATGSDGGGSIRIPAGCCGLVGLKPQRDRIDLAPDRGHWGGLSHAGFLTRSVLDTALLLDAAADEGGFADAASGPVGSLRIAWTTQAPVPAALSGDVRAALTDTVAELRRLGHAVDDAAATPDYGLASVAFSIRYAAGARADLVRLADPRLAEGRTRTIARLGGALPGAARRWAQRAGDDVSRRLAPVFDAADVLVTPLLTTAPPPHTHFRGRGGVRTAAAASRFMPFAPVWNVTGQPAMAVPAGFSADGLPLTVQLVGRPGGEATLLALAAQLEAARGWTGARPPVR